MDLITSGDATYDDDRSLFNSMIDKRPAVIAKCTSARDVVEALELAARERYAVAVRAGGHSVAGMSSNDDGIVIDVRPMKHIEIDAAAMTARVGAGVIWSEFDRAGHGLATTGGRVSTTGVAGPDPQGGQQPGAVFIGIAFGPTVTSLRLDLSGDRQAIRTAVVSESLARLSEMLREA